MDFPDRKCDGHGRVIDGAAAVIASFENRCKILLAAHSHGAGVLVEHPVSRREGSRGLRSLDVSATPRCGTLL